MKTELNTNRVGEQATQETNIQRFWSVEDIRREYQRTSQGHFFDEETMKFFASRLTSIFRSLGDNKYLFVTSEKACFDAPSRVFTVRLLTVTRCPQDEKFCEFKMRIDRVETLGGDWQLTRARALSLVKNYEKLAKMES